MIFTGKVVRIMEFGAFVELAPNKDGMVRISKLSDKRVAKVEDVVNIGDVVTVRVTEVDRMGRINLTMRPEDMTADLEKLTRPEKREERRDRGTEEAETENAAATESAGMTEERKRRERINKAKSGELPDGGSRFLRIVLMISPAMVCLVTQRSMACFFDVAVGFRLAHGELADQKPLGLIDQTDLSHFFLQWTGIFFSNCLRRSLALSSQLSA